MEKDWEKIRTKTKGEWKNMVKEAVDRKNKSKIVDDCTEQTEQGTKVKTKTSYIHTALTNAESLYKNEPLNEIINMSKLQTRTVVIARNGMLECGSNFKGTMNETCITCNLKDNEHHRLSECSKWKDNRNTNSSEGVDFQDIYSNSKCVLEKIINQIQSLWELTYGNGKIKR